LSYPKRQLINKSNCHIKIPSEARRAQLPPLDGLKAFNMAVLSPGTTVAARGAARRVGLMNVGAIRVGAIRVGAIEDGKITLAGVAKGAMGKVKVIVPSGGGAIKLVILKPAGVTAGAVVVKGKTAVLTAALRYGARKGDVNVGIKGLNA